MTEKVVCSKIVNWWVAHGNEKMAFVNIFSAEPLAEDLVIVGHPRDGSSNKELWHSTNKVTKVSRLGVQTSQGTFYPFEEAHGVYLRFLTKVNKNGVLHAFRWDYVNPVDPKLLVAHIEEPNGNVRNTVVFEGVFEKDESGLIYGYSDTLNGKVVFSVFSKRGVCLVINLPDEILDATYKTGKLSDETRSKVLKKVRKMARNRFE